MSELELYLEVENRRVSNRHNRGLKAVLTTGDTDAPLLNYSSSGLRFVGTNHQVKDNMELRLRTNFATFKLRAKKAWSKPLGPNRKVVGVAFTESEDLKRLQWLMETLG